MATIPRGNRMLSVELTSPHDPLPLSDAVLLELAQAPGPWARIAILRREATLAAILGPMLYDLPTGPPRVRA